MQIRVIRAAGDKQGPNITDELLTDEFVGRERGTWAINDNTSKLVESGNGPLSAFVDTGLLAQVTTKKGSTRGKIRYFSQTIDLSPDGSSFNQTSSFIIEKVL